MKATFMYVTCYPGIKFHSMLKADASKSLFLKRSMWRKEEKIVLFKTIIYDSR